ncbi:hypothetical protein EV421DRAFT_1904565 [Armillaria borealis]|uniref:Uncharacterized protein n=1 Tax=Armillaria borealis TaxID=47425 RepID=A0AA39MQ62_9AGAR|nr:hypothetical protein EV421DRAFT_1904565 [Armillaria borealis]
MKAMVLAFACADCGSTSVTLDAVISKHQNDRGRVPLSSIASLLQSNNAPTIAEFKSLKESVNSVDEALDQLSIDIHEMSEALARLKERRGQLADVKDKYQIAVNTRPTRAALRSSWRYFGRQWIAGTTFSTLKMDLGTWDE